MGAPSVARDDRSSGNFGGNCGHFRRRWFSFKSFVLFLVTLLLTATAICVLHQLNEPRDEQQPADLGSLLDGFVLPASNSAVAASSQNQEPSNGWLLFDKTATDSRPARSANDEPSQTKSARELTKGFKWATGAMLDDFALGMGPEDFDESNDQIANNNYTQSESSRDSGAQPTTARAVAHAKQEAHHKETLDLVARNSSGANKVQYNRGANVINNSNISYSKTRQDLRDARAKLEQLRRQQLAAMAAPGANQSTPLPVTPPLQTSAPQNVSLFNRNSISDDASSTFASNSSNNKTNEASSPSKSPAILGLEEHKRHSRAAKMRHKRRAGIIESERGKPILNEFSFPANLVQGMRFVLMCQVLDGEPPIQIKWFKDSQDLEQLLQNSRANQDNHQQLQTSSDEIGPAASKLISLVAASSGDVPSADSSAAGAAVAGQQQHLEHIEMISNDELGSSLLFRKVKQQHGGNYTCLASNRHGASSYTSLMTVKVPPSWRVEPQDCESIMGEQITIDCQAVGNPNPFLRWKFATSVQHDKTPSDPSVLQTPSTLAANHQATSVAGSSITANQNLQQQHLHSFKLLNSNHHVQTLENGSLIIRQAGKEHEGLYLCEADNGVEPSLMKQIKLIVHKQAHFLDDIQILVQPSSGQQDQRQQQSGAESNKGLAQKDAAGSLSLLQQFNQLTPSIKVASLPQNTSLVRLVCSPYGDVPLQLDWLKDGHLIHTHSTNGANFHAVTSGGLESGRDSSASSALLEPTSTDSRYHVSSRWSTHRSLSAGSSGLESELLLANLGRHDAGLYTCSARNAFGQSERKLRLVVQEQPEAPTMVDVARISSRSISLRWLAPFDGNSPITKYVIEYKKQPADSAISQHPTGDNQPMSRSEKKMLVVATSKTSSETNSASIVDSPFPEQATITGLRPQMVGGIQLNEPALEDRTQIQHTVHDLEPMTTYTMRVMAVNALGQSRPSIALSLRTEEEVPATVPDMVEAIVLSSSSIKLRWTISYSYEHELIDGFFIGYRSFDSSALLVDSASVNGNDQSLASNTIQESGSGGRLTAKQMIERPTFTYKTIRLINRNQAQQQPPDEAGQNAGGVNNPQAPSPPLSQQQGSDATPVVAPISSVTKTMPINSIFMAGGTSKQFVSHTSSPGTSVGQQVKPNQQQGEMGLVVVSNFEFVINGLERNTEYTILIQCFNKKGTGPSSDPVVTKTLQHDPPQKLTLVANELTETSLRLSWHFPNEMKNLMAASNQQDYVQHSSAALGGRMGQGLMELVDGFVLTFAKIAQQTGNLSMQNSNNKRPQDFSSMSPTSLTGSSHDHPQYPPSNDYKQQRMQQNQQANSAARISKQNSPTNSNFQYNPPIQPSQLLDHQWQAIQLSPHQREHVLKSLECGTWYAMKIWAFNKVGKGEASDLVKVNTRGKAPLAPSRSAFLSTNSTQVKLNLNAWYDGGCEIEKFIIQYRVRGQQEWILFSNNILKEQGELIIRDLSPATAYELLVGAQNHVNLSEAKYRFTTLDLEGKQVVPSKSSSFLPTLNDDYNDENNSMIDYSDESQYSSSGSNIRRESVGSDFGFSRSSQSGQQWLMMASHVLNSPLTLLFTFCIFLVLLGLLAFNRFNGNTEHRHYNSGNSSSGKTTMECNDGANGGSNLVRRCSIDEMATMLDGNGSGPPMSCTTNGSSTASTDSPGRMVNVHAASSGHMNPAHPVGPTYAPLDCYGTSSYCSTGVQQSSVAYGSLAPQANNLSNLHPDIGNGHQHGQRPSGSNWGGANMDNYSSDLQHQNQHAVGFYSALPTANYSEAAPLNQTIAPRSASMDHDGNHQHLMQMLLIPPQHQQHQQSNQMSADYTPSMTTNALTTLARQKAGLVKTPNGATECNNSLFQHGPSFTLGRVPTQNQECFHAANCNSNNDEHYQMNIIDTLTRKRKALLRLDRRQQDLTDLYHDTSSTNLSSSFTSTSGCGTATASTSQGGGVSGETQFRLDPIGDKDPEAS